MEMNILIVFAAPLTSLTCNHDYILLLSALNCITITFITFAFESQLQHCSLVRLLSGSEFFFTVPSEAPLAGAHQV